ncbi:unnamed protein product [Ambrosiozyma monospora]|uniref:Unnamed protein product n=1 Tax=Ambrosiozyma monospora TaxID=43982 RepID=A0ACB5UAS4_AMBMO|nr:unnamed protein product [Ambrosiozyma monospora]
MEIDSDHPDLDNLSSQVSLASLNEGSNSNSRKHKKTKSRHTTPQVSLHLTSMSTSNSSAAHTNNSHGHSQRRKTKSASPAPFDVVMSDANPSHNSSRAGSQSTSVKKAGPSATVSIPGASSTQPHKHSNLSTPASVASTGPSGPSGGNNKGGNGGANEDDELYCFCQQVSYGDMIACDNSNCKYEWFHYGCVGLTEPPKGIWYCPDCAKQAELTASTTGRKKERRRR